MNRYSNAWTTSSKDEAEQIEVSGEKTNGMSSKVCEFRSSGSSVKVICIVNKWVDRRMVDEVVKF